MKISNKEDSSQAPEGRDVKELDSYAAPPGLTRLSAHSHFFMQFGISPRIIISTERMFTMPSGIEQSSPIPEDN